MNELMFVKSEMLSKELNCEEEPMDIGELYNDYEEEGEIRSSGDDGSDEDSNVKKDVRSLIRSENTWTSFARGKTDEVKKMQRAKRFGITVDESYTEVTPACLSRLHKSLGIDNENVRHYVLNAIHVRGTQDMSTQDVFEYFDGFTPYNIEWINDLSCNVLWVDDISAARAMLALSKEIKNLDKIRLCGNPFQKELKGEDSDLESNLEVDAIDARDIAAPIPPGHWRIGVPTRKSPAILLRFATKSDKKQKFAEKNSEYYKRYGNPHFGNIPGLISKSLRSEISKKYKKIPNRQFDKTLSDEHYDRNGRKNPWGDLAQEWNQQDRTLEKSSQDARSKISLKRNHLGARVPDLRMSINSKCMFTDNFHTAKVDRDFSTLKNDEDIESRVKFPRMKMYADEEQKFDAYSSKRLGSLVVTSQVEDLRNKIDRKKRTKKMLISSRRRRKSRTYNNSTEEDDDCDYDDDDKESANWALEQYSDLRESLEQNKKYRHLKNRRLKNYSDSEENEDDNSDIFDGYTGELGRRSPLQIEIENDGYFANESDNTL